MPLTLKATNAAVAQWHWHPTRAVVTGLASGRCVAANWSEPRLFRDPWRVNMTAAKKNLDTVGETSRRAMTVKEVEAERRKA